MNMFKSRIFFFIAVVSLNFKLCFTGCAPAEYEINGECCPMCAPGNHVYKHCYVGNITVCIPCPESSYSDEPNGLISCFPCSLCDTGQGLRVQQTCTQSSDTICEPLEGFYCVKDNKGICTSAMKHSKCKPGQYIKQTGTALTDTVCVDSSTYCKPDSKCEIKLGTNSPHVESPRFRVVISGILIGVMVSVVVFLCIRYKRTCKTEIHQNSTDSNENHVRLKPEHDVPFTIPTFQNQLNHNIKVKIIKSNEVSQSGYCSTYDMCNSIHSPLGGVEECCMSK